ncbi:MAG TPA: hypothetical protein VGM88_04165 [Kofleriaceae bacterium]|jgi:hypothetical protein
MRWILIAVALSACDSMPDPPSPAAFAKLTDEQKCNAVFPRVGNCVNEVIVHDLHALDGSADEMQREVAKQLADQPRSSKAARVEIIRNSCLGDPSFAPDVFACWKTEGCDALVRCIESRHH